MKKFFALAAMLLSLTAASAQEQKEELKAPLSETDNALQLAVQLSRYGYANKSVLSLVEAAKIVKANGFEQGTRSVDEGRTEAPATDQKAGQISLDPAKLLADAEELAGKDKTLLAVVKAAKEDAATRGAVGGPKYDIGNVSAYSSVTYRVNFRAGELAQVMVIGDGDTDLDLYVYDENGNEIDSDTDSTDYCICSVTPKWTGEFKIKIRNYGDVYNHYNLRIFR